MIQPAQQANNQPHAQQSVHLNKMSELSDLKWNAKNQPSDLAKYRTDNMSSNQSNLIKFSQVPNKVLQWIQQTIQPIQQPFFNFTKSKTNNMPSN